MSNTSQTRALKNYRKRLTERGMVRFEVVGLDVDRQLIRSVAKRLAENDTKSVRLRAEMSATVNGAAPKTGGILAALRRSPMVDAEIDVTRDKGPGRKVDL
jgi:hypothetical protein